MIRKTFPQEEFRTVDIFYGTKGPIGSEGRGTPHCRGFKITRMQIYRVAEKSPYTQTIFCYCIYSNVKVKHVFNNNRCKVTSRPLCTFDRTPHDK
jgi:hypothetical protein